MPAGLFPCHVEAVQDEHEADVIVHSVFQHLDNTLSSGLQQRRTRSHTYDAAFVVDFLNEQLLHAPFKVFAATAWLQAKVCRINITLPLPRTTTSIDLRLMIRVSISPPSALTLHYKLSMTVTSV